MDIAHNIGNLTYTDIQLSVELYDKNNTLIGVEKGSPNADLGPGDTSPFKISTSESVKNSDFDHFRITVAGIKTDGVNNSSTFGSTMPSKEGYDKCTNFAGNHFVTLLFMKHVWKKLEIQLLQYSIKLRVIIY